MMMQESVGVRDRQLSGQYSKDQLQQRPSMNTNGEREQDQALKCPRCDSPNTKFCYYNNYNLTQPRHFCKTCRRYWTKGGALRNVPIGGGCRKNKKSKQRPKDQNPLSPVDHDTSLNVSNGLSLLHNLWPTPAAASSASTFLDLPSPDRFVNLTFAKLQNHSSLLLGNHPNNAGPNTINSSSSNTASIMSMLQQQQQELSTKGDNIDDPSGGHMINLFRNPGGHMMAPPSSSSTIEAGNFSLNFGVESLSINNNTCVDTRDWAWRLQQQQRLGMGMVMADQSQTTGMDSVIPIPDHLILGDQRYSHVQHHYMKGKTANDLVHNQPYDIRPLSEWQSMADSLLEVTPTPAPALGESSSYWHDLQPM